MRLLNWLLGPNPRFKILGSGGKIPTRGTDGASGFDVYSPRSYTLTPNVPVLIPLRIAYEFRNDWVSTIWARSSIGKAGVDVLAGVNDPDYRGELHIVLLNTTAFDIVINKGDRIAQMLFMPCFMGKVTSVTRLSETTRGEGRHGSTGR